MTEEELTALEAEASENVFEDDEANSLIRRQARAIAELRRERGAATCDPDGCKAHINAFMRRAEAAEARVARLEAALRALDAATVSAIHENEKPNRVLFKDGFVLEGRGADEWLRFMRLIQTACRATLDVKDAT